MSPLFYTTPLIHRSKMAIAAVLIVAGMVAFTPKRTDAIILAILGAVGAGAVAAIIVELVIYCAVGLICGGGGGGGGTPGTGGPGTPGDQCNSTANSCGEYTSGTYNSAGVCSATPPSDWTGPGCTTPGNYCGMTASGSEHCSGDGRCSVSTPADSLCTGLPLPPDALVINPNIVRIGDDANDDITISWNTGQNFPANCTITGPGLPAGFTITSPTGTVTISNITGQREYTLACGSVSVSQTVLVLPSLYES